MAAEPAARTDPDRPVLPTDAQRRALRFVESVYKQAVTYDRGKSLKHWIRPEEGSVEHRTARNYVLQEVLRAWVRAGEVPADQVSEVGEREAFYRRQAQLAAPLIATSAREWMRGTLDIQQGKLSDVMIRALRSSEGAQRAATEVVQDAKTRLVSIRDPDSYAVLYPANFSWPRDGDTMTRVKKLQYIAIVRDRLAQLMEPPPELGRATDRGIRRVEGYQLTDLADARVTTTSQAVYRPARLIEGYELLQLLLWHPRGAAFVNAFQRSGLSGTQLATAALRDSLIACATARSTIDDDLSRVWRISPAVAAGVAKLGSQNPVALTSYALAWASTEKTFIEKGIAFLSDVTAAIGLFGGPAGEVVEAVADLILSGASTAVSFLKQQEQEQAFLATAFEKESERLSSGGRYASTVLEGAAALVAAVALPGAVQSVTRRATAGAAKVARAPARASPSPSPTKSRDTARGLITSDLGPEAARATAIRGKATEDVFEAASPGRKRAATPDVTPDPEAVVQDRGISVVDRPPPRAEPAGKATGLHGEGLEQVAAGIRTEVRNYTSVLSPASRKQLREMFERDLLRKDPAALKKHVERIAVPPQGLKEVELLVVVPDGKFRKLGTRKPDRLFVDGDKVVLVESKRYTESALEFAGRVRKQITNDEWILNQFDYAKVEYFLSGNVTKETMRELQALEARYGGRFVVRRWTDLKEV